MQLKEFNIMLDIKKHRKNEEIEIVQGDFDTNIVNITLYDGLNVYSLDGLIVEIAFAKPDGTTVLQGAQDEVNPIAIAGNKIICTLKTNTIAAPGKVIAEVRILDNDRLLTSTRFEFYVRKAIVNDETIESTNEFPLLKKLTDDVEGIITTEEARVTAENARKANETSRVNAEKQRVQSEQQRATTFAGYENRVSTVENDLTQHKLEYAQQANVILKNLISNGSFENGKNSWVSVGSAGTGGGSSIDSTIIKSGTSSLKIMNNNGSRREEQSVSRIIGHKYYLKGNIFIESHTSGTIWVTPLMSAPIKVNEWQVISSVHTAPSTALNFWVGSNNNATYVAYFDDLLMIDLTETFGEGNEPTKEEMDLFLQEMEIQWIDKNQSPIDQKRIFNYLLKQDEKIKQNSATFTIETLENKVMPIVAITTDDGMATDYQLYKMLQSKGMRGTSFIVGSYIGNTNYLTETQIKEMADAGYEIASHTYQHKNLTLETFPQGVIYQVLENKKHLENLTGKKVETLAFPFGGTNAEVRNLVRAFHEGARTSDGGKNEFGDVANIYNIKTHWLDYASYDVARVKGIIDDLVSGTPSFVILSGHALASESGGNALTLAEMEEIADYLKMYQMQGELEVVTFAEGVRRIKSMPFFQ